MSIYSPIPIALGNEIPGQELNDQISKICYVNKKQLLGNDKAANTAHKMSFCALEFSNRLFKRVDFLNEVLNYRSKWSRNILMNFLKAFRLNFVVMEERFRTLTLNMSNGKPFNPKKLQLRLSEEEKSQGFKNMVDLLLQLIENGDAEQLKVIVQLLPIDVIECHDSTLKSSDACNYRNMARQMLRYFTKDDVDVNGRRRVMLPTNRYYNTDYVKLLLLQSTQVNEILKLVRRNEGIMIELVKVITHNINSRLFVFINSRFLALRNYFVYLQGYNEGKSNAAIGVIDSWKGKHRSSLVYLTKAVSTGLKDLILSYKIGKCYFHLFRSLL